MPGGMAEVFSEMALLGPRGLAQYRHLHVSKPI